MPKGKSGGARLRVAWHGRIPAKIRMAGAAVLAVFAPWTPALADGFWNLPTRDISPDEIMLLGTAAGLSLFAVTAAAALVRYRRKAVRLTRQLETENRELKFQVDRLETMLNTDEQRVITWTGNGAVPQVWGILSERSGVPKNAVSLLAFGNWLNPKSAADLESHLDVLFSRGEAFTLTLKTLTGTFVEAIGRTTGGAVVLRLRDLSGERQMQAELAARNARISGELHMLHALLNAVPAPAWQRDAEGRLIWANAAYAAAVEAPDTGSAIRDARMFLDADALSAMDAGRKEDGVYTDRIPIVTSGERRVFEVTDVTANVGSSGMAVDVSELDSVRKELKRTEEFHGRTLNQLATAVAIFGADHRLQFHNEAFRQLWDLDQAFLEGRPEDGAVLDALRAARKLPEQADYRGWRSKMLESYQSVRARETWWHLPDGRTLRVIANPHPQGGVTYIYENVTEQLNLESRFNALTRVQGETLDNLSEAVAVFGSDGRLNLWNPAFARVWSLGEDQLTDMPHVKKIVEACMLRPDERNAWDRLAERVTGLPVNRIQAGDRMERHDGTVLDYSVVPLPDGGTLVTFVDVSDSVNVERALLEKNEALEQADELKNAFIQHVSYELRSPLTNIIGFAQLLSDPKFGDLSARQDEYANYILSSSAALLAIINDILDLATLDAGIMELDLGEVDVAATVDAAIEGLQDRLKEARINLRTHVQGDIGVMVADEKRLRQVLFNLISNAVRYSEEEGVIDVTCSRDKGDVLFVVKDRGCGIPAEVLNQVFNRFVGHDSGAKRQGAGLGLSIVKSFVELHGGTVDIASEEGKGTTVTCSFPEKPQATGRVAAE
ncbi:PAS domain-containing sensor histidine kinase [Roseibium sp. RKSG952]|uniref:sensor histidine kinase n=1 Tax=Roseibium sp. RKSG952 TaxID=2529384 RepID=UPI0012BBEE8B|nr:PAS domain-containing sensor histidine kinase [Roseibium sp. RKSG952]MTI00285.1 PAS domain-containing sensor histidine kinase [Roseibium sp. RKSG952]